jgi:hypothetical protein
MAKVGRKAKEMKHVGFRIPLDLYQDYLSFAEARSVDLTALFLLCLNECRPMLLLKHAKHKTAMLNAALADPQQNAPDNEGEQTMIAAATDLIRQMEGLAIILRQRSSKECGQRAA